MNTNEQSPREKMKTSNIKARKPKPCLCCLGQIDVGELYSKEVIKHKGGFDWIIEEWEDGYTETIYFHSDKQLCNSKNEAYQTEINNFLNEH